LSINHKLVPAVVALALLPLLLFGYFCINRATAVIESYVVEEVEGQAEQVSRTLLVDRFFPLNRSTPTSQAALQDFVASYNHLSGRDIVILDRERMVLADAEPHNVGSRFPHFSQGQARITAILDEVLRRGRRGSFEEQSDDGNFHLVAVPITTPGGEVLGAVVLEYSSLYKAALVVERELQKTLALGNLLIAALALLLALFLSRKISRPVQELSQVVKAIGEGDFSRQAEVKSPDELGELAASCNKMGANLARLLEQEHQAVTQEAAVSAQLRQEISERQNIENALRESEELYRSLVENIGLGVVLINRDYDIVMANSAQTRTVGRNLPELVGKKCFQMFRRENQICPHCPGGRAMAEMQVCETDIEVVRPGSDRKRVMRLRAFPVQDKEGRAAGFIEVTEDITERRNIEEELRRSKHLEMIGTLAGGIAHDFNNLLAGIIGNVTLAKLYLGQPEKSREKLEICEKAVERARDLSQQLLTFAKGGAPVKEIMPVADLLREVVAFSLSGTSVSCVYDLPADLWMAELDRGQIGQVFQNLVANAVQAMAGEGELTISGRNLELAESTLALAAGRYVKISIRDRGVGIAPEILERIFEPFFTTKQKGSGLGLAICYSIVAKHLGRIEAESVLGQGATFHLWLPASISPAAYADEGEAPPLGGKGRILVMDDEAVVREAAAELLTCLGYKVETAEDGLEAVDHYRKAAAAGQKFDAVILDLTVPGGMGGLEAMQRLTEYGVEVRAIVSSGYTNDSVLADYRQHGFRGLISKPYNINELSKVVAEVVGAGG